MNQPPEHQTETSSTVADELEKFLGRKKQADAELSGAFQRAITQEPDLQQVRQLQLQTKDQVESLGQLVRSLKRNLLVLNCSLIALILSCAAGFTFFYTQWLPAVSDDAVANAKEALESSDSPSALESALPLAIDFPPLSEADRALYPLIFDLHRRALQFQRLSSARSEAEQIDRGALYVQFLTDATFVAEKAAQENVSQELSLAIVKIVELARQSRNHIGTPLPETELLHEEIRAILRRFTPRDDRFDPTRM